MNGSVVQQHSWTVANWSRLCRFYRMTVERAKGVPPVPASSVTAELSSQTGDWYFVCRAIRNTLAKFFWSDAVMKSNTESIVGAPRPGVRSAVVVGASLAGLMTALTLSRSGLQVTVLERAADSGRTGAALIVESGLITRLTGVPSTSQDRAVAGRQSWHGAHNVLSSVADADPRITVRSGTTVVHAGQDENHAFVVTDDGKRIHGDIVIGADGHRSVVRAAVSPDNPDATFAGYVIWIGLADEAALPVRKRPPSGPIFLDGTLGPLLGGPLPIPEGASSRQLYWAWYDASHNSVLRAQGAVVDNVVRHTLNAGDVPDATYEQLAAQAKHSFEAPWLDAILDCVERRAIIGTPIAEYVPDRLVRNRIGLVGDAAHVPTPMTGNGFSASVDDAEAVARAVANPRIYPADALELYERTRLDSVRRLVQSGQRFSRSFGRKAD